MFWKGRKNSLVPIFFTLLIEFQIQMLPAPDLIWSIQNHGHNLNHHHKLRGYPDIWHDIYGISIDQRWRRRVPSSLGKVVGSMSEITMGEFSSAHPLLSASHPFTAATCACPNHLRVSTSLPLKVSHFFLIKLPNKSPKQIYMRRAICHSLCDDIGMNMQLLTVVDHNTWKIFQLQFMHFCHFFGSVDSRALTVCCGGQPQ